MKKSLLLSFFSVIGLSVLAQPALQSSEFYPIINESFTVHSADYETPGSSGNNVTWDLSGLVSTYVSTYTFTSPDPNFPGSTHKLDQNGFLNQHLDLSTDDYLSIGESDNFREVNYTNPATMFKFPLNYGDAYTDDFAGTMDFNGTIDPTTGTIEFEVDGFGTLITPAGTFTDTYRIHYTKTTNSVFQGANVTSVEDTYLWIKSDFHYLLASSTTFTSPSETIAGSGYVESTLDIDKYAKNNPLTLYPNPAQDIVSLKYDLAIDKVEVCDLNGRSVAIQYNSSTKSIDISELNSGLYYVTVISNNSKSIQKLLKR